MLRLRIFNHNYSDTLSIDPFVGLWLRIVDRSDMLDGVVGERARSN